MSNLIINKKQQQTLTQNQYAFNKLTAKIEKLRSDIQKKQLQLDKAMLIYSASIHPLRGELYLQSKRALEVLWPLYKSKKLALPDQKLFKEVLQHLLNEVFKYKQTDDEPDDLIKTIFRELEGITYEKAKKDEENDMRDDMQNMFDDMGIDIDLTNFDPTDEKSFAEKIAEAKQKMGERQTNAQQNQQRQHQQKQKTKSNKQLEKERLRLEADQIKQKNISTIYKQLAKLFHPDLEQDESRKAEKELLMQELTAAYEAKNLHTLLSLEMKWIHKENDHLGTLTDEKLKIYLQILREQADELEQEKELIIRQPRYSVLVEEYGFRIASQPVATLEHEAKNMKIHIKDLKHDIADFESPIALKHVKAMLKEWKNNRKHEADEDAFINMMLNGGW